MSNSLLDIDLDNEQEGGAEEEAVHPFHQPYNSYSFAASSWQLRKNLAETFDQHVNNDDKQKDEKQNDVKRLPLERIAPFSKINSTSLASQDTLKQAPGRSIAMNALGKPPRKPFQATGTTSTNTNTKTGTGDKRCVSVFLRVRPPKEGTANTIEIIQPTSSNLPPTKIRTHAPEKSNAAKVNRETGTSFLHSFATTASATTSEATVVREFDFEQVFGPNTENESVYENVVAPMVDRLFPSPQQTEPESGLLLAYGATNSGKTYSILGNLAGETPKNPATQMGLVPRAISSIVDRISGSKLSQQHAGYELYMSYFEIFNDNIYDLLPEQTGNNVHNRPFFVREPLKLRESRKQTFIRGLLKKKVGSVEEGLNLARLANSKRHTSSNNLNASSSRSHCICQLEVRRQIHLEKTVAVADNKKSGYSTDEEASQISKQKATTLWIVDLAGNERSKRTNVGMLRQKEASMINKELMNLMRCMSIMRENQSSKSSKTVIPFRDQKLTHLFMPVFTGSTSSVSMIVCANPEEADFDETSHVLSYASKAKTIAIEAKLKEDTTSTQTNTSEYGYDGRPINQKKKTVTSKFASLVKKLSPKKLTKLRAGKGENPGKRKAAPALSRFPSSSSLSTASISNQSGPQAKRLRAKPANTNQQQPKNELSRVDSKSNKNGDDEISSLKTALSIAQAEIEALKTENATLQDNMGELEINVRAEVLQESQDQVDSLKRHYTEIIEKMKAQTKTRPSVGVFEKQARETAASDKLEEVLEMLQESEAENKRLQSELDEERKNNVVHAPNASEQVLRNELQEKEEQMKNLQDKLKSKLDLIREYEQLLAEQGEDENPGDDGGSTEEAGSDMEDEDDEESEVEEELKQKVSPLPPRGTKTGKHRSPLSSIRSPLSSISSNIL